MPIHPSTVTLQNFKGLNNVLEPSNTAEDFLKEALNIDIDKVGGIGKRSGYVKRITGDFHSLWSDGTVCLAVKDGDIVSIDSGFNIQILVSGVGNEAVSFDTNDLDIYYSSTSVNGIINRKTLAPRNWGLEKPNPIPFLTSGPGLLFKGSYRVTYTFVDSEGRESGAPVSGHVIDLNDNQRIIVSGLYVPTDPSIVGRNIYCTARNGSEYFLIKTVPIAQTTLEINDVQGIYPLKSQNVYPAPLGHKVKYAHSRLWVADEDVLWYSDPLTYDWFRYASSFFQFESRIRAIMPTQDGMWVATNRLYYLAGKDPSAMTRTEKEPVKAVEGSEVKIVGSYLFIDNTPIGYKWLVTTDQGVFACYNDGVTINLTSRSVNYPVADKGTGAFIQTNGINKYTTILQKKADSSNLALGDQLTGTIIRNGVKVEE